MKQSDRSTQGAAYVEFLIAILPILTFFWGIMQMNGLLLADLFARNAAVNAVRAAIVCGSDQHPEDDGQLGAKGGCSYEAARMSLLSLGSAYPPGGSEPGFAVSVRGASPHGNDPVTATVYVDYYCRVPLVGPLVCGLATHDESTHGNSQAAVVLTRSATLPNQGANYKFSSQSSTQ